MTFKTIAQLKRYEITHEMFTRESLENMSLKPKKGARKESHRISINGKVAKTVIFYSIHDCKPVGVFQSEQEAMRICSLLGMFSKKMLQEIGMVPQKKAVTTLCKFAFNGEDIDKVKNTTLYAIADCKQLNEIYFQRNGNHIKVGDKVNIGSVVSSVLTVAEAIENPPANRDKMNGLFIESMSVLLERALDKCTNNGLIAVIEKNEKNICYITQEEDVFLIKKMCLKEEYICSIDVHSEEICIEKYPLFEKKELIIPDATKYLNIFVRS